MIQLQKTQRLFQHFNAISIKNNSNNLFSYTSKYQIRFINTQNGFPKYEPIEMSFTHYPAENPIPNQPPFVMIHGLFGNKMNLMSTGNLLKKRGIEIYSLDLRNHGTSPHSEEMNFIAIRNDIKAFLDSKGITECDIFGFSLGGRSTMFTILDESLQKYFRRVIIGDISPVTYTKWDIPTTMEMLLRLDLNVKRRAELDEQLLNMGMRDKSMRDFLLSNVITVPGGQPFKWRINLLGIHKNLKYLSEFPIDPETMTFQDKDLVSNNYRVKAFDKPFLLIRGQESDLVKPEKHLPLFKKYFPQFEMVTYEKTGHWVHYQDIGRFTEDVYNFITKTDQ